MSVEAPCLLACDLGTGGNKASLYTVEGEELGSTFVPYATYYPAAGHHEQAPEDWWQAVVTSIRKLMADSAARSDRVDALAVSGQSLAMVPVDAEGRLLRTRIPIWSDSRASAQTSRFFRRVDERARLRPNEAAAEAQDLFP